MISIKKYNYDYAPGLATYGLQGLDGSTGKNANNLFYTNFDLKDGATTEFVYQLNNGYVPIKNSTTKTDREYQVGDYFFTTDGQIFELTSFGTVDTTKVEVVGRIQIDANTLNGTMHFRDNRLQLDSSCNGFDIVLTSSANTSLNTNAVMNIVSDKADENNEINMIQMSAVDIDNLTNGDLRIFYSTTDKAYHLESVYPIIIDSKDIKVSNDSPEVDYDDYSEIVTSQYPLTRFKQYCDQLEWKYETRSGGGRIIISTLDEQCYKQLKNLKNYLIYKIYDNMMGVQLIRFGDDAGWDDTNKKITLTTTEESLNPDALSMLYNTEVFIKKASNN